MLSTRMEKTRMAPVCTHGPGDLVGQASRTAPAAPAT
ncbi:hypothetical protein GZL_08094 [Streptomyces sp. 769]|nr:hypothetical protein GZL_08094 [Streptomyces sp. 769]